MAITSVYTMRSRIWTILARIFIIPLLILLVYRVFVYPTTDSVMELLSGIGMFFMAFYTKEQLKERPFDIFIATGSVVILALVLIHSDFLYSIVNIEIPPIKPFIRFILVVFAGLITVFVSMMCNDLYPNFVHWIAKQNPKPIAKPLRMWIIFFILTFVAAVCSAVAAVAPTK
jgi:hypothetical protein